MGQPGQLHHQRPVAGVFRMKAQLITDQGILTVPVHIFLFHLGYGGGKIVQAADQHTAHPHVQAGPGRDIGPQIHIKDSRDAAGKIFQHRQTGHLINILVRQLLLQGKHFLLQPTLQRHIIRCGAQESHGRVGMGILKTGHQQILLTVHLIVPGDVGDTLSPPLPLNLFLIRHIDDFFVFNPDLTPKDVPARLHGQDSGII